MQLLASTTTLVQIEGTFQRRVLQEFQLLCSVLKQKINFIHCDHRQPQSIFCNGKSNFIALGLVFMIFQIQNFPQLLRLFESF